MCACCGLTLMCLRMASGLEVHLLPLNNKPCHRCPSWTVPNDRQLNVYGASRTGRGRNPAHAKQVSLTPFQTPTAQDAHACVPRSALTAHLAHTTLGSSRHVQRAAHVRFLVP